MASKPTYEELEQRTIELEQTLAKHHGLEKRLQESEARFHHFYENSPVPYQSCDKNGFIVTVNPAWLNLLGYREDEVVSRWFGDFLPEKMKKKYKELFSKIKTLGTLSGVEFELISKDGTLKTVSFESRISCDETGRYKQTHCIFTDITKQKRAEKALQKNLERYKLATSAGKTGVWDLNLETGEIYLDPILRELSGYKDSEIPDTTEDWIHVLHPDIRESAKKEAQAIFDGEKTEYRAERHIIRKDGSKQWFLTIGDVIKDEAKPIRVLGTSTEITQRKNAEEALRKSEEQYRLLADNVTDNIWILSLSDFRILYTSPSIKKILGYSDEEMMQREGMATLTPESREVMTKILFEELDRDDQEDIAPDRHRTLEIEQICKDGSRIWTEITASLLRDKKGRPDRLLGVTRNITERRLVETEKKKLETLLRQAQKMESLGTLAGGIAHDFNNTLAAIINYTELSLIQNENNSVLHSNLEQILQAVKHGKELIKQILTFTRQTDQKAAPVDIRLIITDMLKLLRASLPSTIKIQKSIQVKSGMTLANQTQLHQVLMNLCSNAAYAMRKKGGTLKINLTEKNLKAEDIIHNPELKQGAYLKLTVSDTGQGIDQSDIDRIFDPFFTTKGPGEGTGIGLSVVHGIIKKHHGTISVTSNSGEGTTFHVLLPEIAEKDKTIADILKPVSKKNRGLRILFVDDQNIIAESGKQMLEHLGYNVVAHTSSIKALETFRTQPTEFDLVITDMTMPNLTGMSLSERLLQIRSDIPIILCTGFNEQINTQKAQDIGIKIMLLKPISANELTDTIDKILG